MLPRRFHSSICLSLLCLASALLARTIAAEHLPARAIRQLGSTRFWLGEGNPEVVLSSDGALAAFPTMKYTIALMDAHTGEVQRYLAATPSGVTTLAFSPDRKLLAAVGVANRFQLYNLTSGEVWQTNIRTTSTNDAIAFSADGRVVAYRPNDSTQCDPIYVWNASTHEKIAEITPADDRYPGMALSGDGKLLATCGGLRFDLPRKQADEVRRIVHIWDIATGKAVAQLKVTGTLVHDATFSADGKRLALAEDTSFVSLWDTVSRKQLRRWATLPGTGAPLAFSRDGKRLAASAEDEHGGAVQVWDLTTGQRIAVARCPMRRPTALVPGPTNGFMAAGRNHQKLYIIDVPPGTLRTPHDGHQSQVWTLAFTPDNKTLLSAGADGLRVWETATGREVRHRPFPEVSSRIPFMACALSPDGRYLVRRPRNTSLCTVQETATGLDLVAVVGSHSAGARPVFLSDNGHTLATATTGYLFGQRESYVSTWNVTTGEEGAHIAVPDASDTACAVSPDGRKVAVAEHARRPATGAIRIWDTTRGVQLRQIPTPATNIGGLLYSPDGRLLATSNYQKIQLWDATSGQAGVTLEDPPARPNATMAFSPDGRALAVACADGGKIIIWELASGGVRRVLEGHHGAVYALAFSRDGRLLASGGADTAIFLWDRFGETGTRSQPSTALTPAELQSCWAELGDRHARTGYQATCRLLTGPQRTLAFLDHQLQADNGKAPEATTISSWIMALDDNSFHKRAQAYRELAQAGVAAQPALTRALAEKPSLEKRRRLEALLSELKSARPAPAKIRFARALELLEHLGSPPARRILQRLAEGQADAWLAREAKAALGRLAVRSK